MSRKKTGTLRPGEGEQVGQVWLSAPSDGFPYWRATYENDFGQRKRTSLGRDYSTARQRAEQIDRQLTAGLSPETSNNTTFGDAWERWVQERDGAISPEYVAQLRRAARTKLAPIQDTKLKDLRYIHFQKVLDKVVADGGTSRTQQRLVSQVRPFLKWAYREKLLPYSSREYLERLKLSGTELQRKRENERGTQVAPEDVFTMDEIQALVSSVRPTIENRMKESSISHKWDYDTFIRATELAMLLQVSTGLRQGELRAVEFGDFQNDTLGGTSHFSNFKTLFVARQYREHAGGYKEMRFPKNEKTRTVYVPAWTPPTDTFDGKPRRAEDVLRNYGILYPEKCNREKLRLKKTEALNMLTIRFGWLIDPKTVLTKNPDELLFWKLPKEVEALSIFERENWLRKPDRIFIEQNGRMFYKHTASEEAQELTSVRSGPLPQMGLDKDLTTQFLELLDDGGIKPLRQMLDEHFSELTSRTWNFWKPPHTDTLAVGNDDNLLLWASVRPPRSNTRIPERLEQLNPNGAHLSYSFTREFWNDIVANSGIRNPRKSNGQARSMRNFRHTFATHALRTGTPLALVATQLGHSNASTTLQRYNQTMKPGTAAPISI